MKSSVKTISEGSVTISVQEFERLRDIERKLPAIHLYSIPNVDTYVTLVGENEAISYVIDFYTKELTHVTDKIELLNTKCEILESQYETLQSEHAALLATGASTASTKTVWWRKLIQCMTADK